jgi:DnaJ family protein A protein 2
MAGDLHVRIRIEPHKIFTRNGADLYMEKSITLLEALCGCSFEQKLLDGSTLKLTTLPGDVLSHGIYQCE